MKNELETQVEEATTVRDWTRVVELYQCLLKDEPENIAMLVGLSNAYHMRGESEHAAETLKRAIELDPTCAQAYHDLGGVYYWRKEYWAAAEYQSQAVNLAPDNPYYRLSLSADWFKLREPEAALEQLETAYRLESRSLGKYGRYRLWLTRIFAGFGPVSWLVFWVLVGAALATGSNVGLEQLALWLSRRLHIVVLSQHLTMLRGTVISVPFVITLFYHFRKKQHRRVVWAAAMWMVWAALVWWAAAQ